MVWDLYGRSVVLLLFFSLVTFRGPLHWPLGRPNATAKWDGEDRCPTTPYPVKSCSHRLTRPGETPTQGFVGSSRCHCGIRIYYYHTGW